MQLCPWARCCRSSSSRATERRAALWPSLLWPWGRSCRSSGRAAERHGRAAVACQHCSCATAGGRTQCVSGAGDVTLHQGWHFCSSPGTGLCVCCTSLHLRAKEGVTATRHARAGIWQRCALRACLTRVANTAPRKQAAQRYVVQQRNTSTRNQQPPLPLTIQLRMAHTQTNKQCVTHSHRYVHAQCCHAQAACSAICSRIPRRPRSSVHRPLPLQGSPPGCSLPRGTHCSLSARTPPSARPTHSCLVQLPSTTPPWPFPRGTGSTCGVVCGAHAGGCRRARARAHGPPNTDPAPQYCLVGHSTLVASTTVHKYNTSRMYTQHKSCAAHSLQRVGHQQLHGRAEGLAMVRHKELVLRCTAHAAAAAAAVAVAQRAGAALVVPTPPPDPRALPGRPPPSPPRSLAAGRAAPRRALHAHGPLTRPPPPQLPSQPAPAPMHLRHRAHSVHLCRHHVQVDVLQHLHNVHQQAWGGSARDRAHVNTWSLWTAGSHSRATHLACPRS